LKIVILGPPGSGKGTQAQAISLRLAVPSISTGEVIRESIKNKSELGKQAEPFINSGELVPDKTVVGIVKNRLKEPDCKEGFILDGFPRTIPQAQALDKLYIKINKVLSLEVPDQNIIERMSGRRICEDCGATYHLSHKAPLSGEICDLCQGNLIRRKDDKPETVKERLRIYHIQTEPLKDFYKKQNKLLEIDGQESIKKTTELTFFALGV
jgi:adenylate kinase